MQRRDRENYYLDIAQAVLGRGTCLRRNFGAIIVKNDQILSTGYAGAPRGRQNCSDLGVCLREKLGVPRGERYELCRSVHAEANAIIHASRSEMTGATLYLGGRGRPDGGAGARREPLLHVQEDDHQRGDFPGNHPEHARLFHGHLRAGMDRKRWIPPGGTGLLRLPPENRLRAMDSGPPFLCGRAAICIF